MLLCVEEIPNVTHDVKFLRQSLDLHQLSRSNRTTSIEDTVYDSHRNCIYEAYTLHSCNARMLFIVSSNKKHRCKIQLRFVLISKPILSQGEVQFVFFLCVPHGGKKASKCKTCLFRYFYFSGKH